MQTFLARQAPKLIGQVIVARSLVHKAALTVEERDALEQIMVAISTEGWSVLAGEVEPILAEIVGTQGYEALAQVGLGVDATPGPFGIVDERAIHYAQWRSAEMVGMRRDELGNLIENPNAEWQITQSTRDMMRGDIETALQEGWSNDKLRDSLMENYAFSKERAMVIARTETNKAASQGALDGYKASGVVEGKLWLTADDDKVSEECEANGAAGVLPLDADFPSGDDAPPVHPNCRCAIAPVVDFDQASATGGAESETTGGESETTGRENETNIADTVTLPEAEVAAAVEIEPEIAAPPAPEPKVTWYGNASDDFVGKMNAAVDALPDGVKQLLADNGINFQFGRRLVEDIRPDLKGVMGASTSAEFRTAWRADLASIRGLKDAALSADLKYYTDYPSEAFAEVYAQLQGAGAHSWVARDTFLSYFPNVAQYITEFLDNL